MGRPIFGANRTVAGFIDAVEGEVHRGSSWTRRVVLRAIVLLPAGGRRGYDEKALGFERPVEQAGDGGIERRALVHNRRSEEHTSELQSLMRTSYAVFCLKKKTHTAHNINTT